MSSRFINDVRSDIGRKAKRSSVRVFFAGQVDAGDILRWNNRLDHFLRLLTVFGFSGSMTVTSNVFY